LIENFSALRAY